MAKPVIGNPEPINLAQSPLSAIQTAINYVPSDKDLLENYNSNFYSTLIKFVIITVIQTIIVVWTLMGGGIADVFNNWPKYRCNPMVMPFASLFGYDAAENFNFCMKNIFSLNAGAVLAPIYGVMANFTEIVGTISNVANSFRYLIANLLHGMERLMGSFRDRFQFILFTIRMSFFKIMNLMGRLYSTFYAVIFMGVSGIQAANNVANNDLVKFLMEFCFDPETIVKLESGQLVSIQTLKIGDRLTPVDGVVPIVTSLFEFDGSMTPLVAVNGVVVSSKHFMRYDSLGSWIEAGLNPDSTWTPSLKRLICLNTSTHTLFINGKLFSDYDESESAEVIKTTQGLAESVLNSGAKGRSVDNYSLGLDPSTLIRIAGGEMVALAKIRIGDILYDGGEVKGLVKECVDSVVLLPDNTRVAAAQLVWNTKRNLWERASNLYKAESYNEIFNHSISTGSVIETRNYMFRDYREVSVPEMEDAYESEIKSL